MQLVKNNWKDITRAQADKLEWHERPFAPFAAWLAGFVTLGLLCVLAFCTYRSVTEEIKVQQVTVSK